MPRPVLNFTPVYKDGRVYLFQCGSHGEKLHHLYLDLCKSGLVSVYIYTCRLKYGQFFAGINVHKLEFKCENLSLTIFLYLFQCVSHGEKLYT